MVCIMQSEVTYIPWNVIQIKRINKRSFVKFQDAVNGLQKTCQFSYDNNEIGSKHYSNKDHQNKFHPAVPNLSTRYDIN